MNLLVILTPTSLTVFVDGQDSVTCQHSFSPQYATGFSNFYVGGFTQQDFFQGQFRDFVAAFDAPTVDTVEDVQNFIRMDIGQKSQLPSRLFFVNVTNCDVFIGPNMNQKVICLDNCSCSAPGPNSGNSSVPCAFKNLQDVINCPGQCAYLFLGKFNFLDVIVFRVSVPASSVNDTTILNLRSQTAAVTGIPIEFIFVVIEQVVKRNIEQNVILLIGIVEGNEGTTTGPGNPTTFDQHVSTLSNLPEPQLRSYVVISWSLLIDVGLLPVLWVLLIHWLP